MRNFVLLVLAVFVFSCREETKAVDPRLLYGQWRNVTMKLHMNTYKGSDSTFNLDVNESNWEKVFNIRPIRTFFWSDGTYNSMHYNLRDSLVYNPSGQWRLVKDSIFMVDTFPVKGPVYKYKLKTDGKMAEFTGVEDLDGDGQADDDYFGTQQHVGRSL
jgi:hypothetical protein